MTNCIGFNDNLERNGCPLRYGCQRNRLFWEKFMQRDTEPLSLEDLKSEAPFLTKGKNTTCKNFNPLYEEKKPDYKAASSPQVFP